MRIWNALAATVAIGLATGINDARAQNYPTRAITLVIPFAPGGSTSIVGRGIADKMSELLGEKVVVDNPPGAGSWSGTARRSLKRARRFTLVLGTGARDRAVALQERRLRSAQGLRRSA
jgi:tripartite-type tricarboxylate transporter receptor subunit TctC